MQGFSWNRLTTDAIEVHMPRPRWVREVFATPLISVVGLSLGVYLLMSRFGLLGNLAPAGVDPTSEAGNWQLTPFGWFLVLLPFIAAGLGLIVAQVRNIHHTKMVDDVLS